MSLSESSSISSQNLSHLTASLNSSIRQDVLALRRYSPTGFENLSRRFPDAFPTWHPFLAKPPVVCSPDPAHPPVCDEPPVLIPPAVFLDQLQEIEDAFVLHHQLAWVRSSTAALLQPSTFCLSAPLLPLPLFNNTLRPIKREQIHIRDIYTAVSCRYYPDFFALI